MIIDRFIGDYAFLSNFYMDVLSPNITNLAVIIDKKVRFPAKSAEHVYQACKASNYKDVEAILNAPTPGEARRLGNKVKVNPEFDKNRISIMEKIIANKFSIKDLEDKLVDTYPNALVEGNVWGDTFWGIDLTGNGAGQNNLGKILMAHRKLVLEKGYAPSVGLVRIVIKKEWSL